MMRARFGLFLLLATNAFSEVILSGWVPNSFMPQGQVQLIRDNQGTPVVQVLLHTRFLDRVVRSITAKETSNWPEDHPDARAYLSGLERARQSVHQRSGGKGREVLVICFDLAGPNGEVRWLTGNIREADGHWTLQDAVGLGAFVPTRTYLVQNAALILEDSLGMSRAELVQRIQNAWTADDLKILSGDQRDG